MSYRYLVLFGEDEKAATMIPAMSVAGLRPCMTMARMSLFIADGTPWIPLPGGGAAIGHLYSRSGDLVQNSEQLGTHADPVRTRRHIVENCWGEYLLLQPDNQDEGSFAITRAPAPAGDFPCIYSLKRGTGFVASDISLPMNHGICHKTIDWDMVGHYLAYPQIKTSRTGIAGIHELLPGNTLHVGDGGSTVSPAWSPWDFVSAERRHGDLHEAAALVRQAVFLAVRTAARDEPSILLELSGGLDSSIIGACLKGSRASVVCATLQTPVPGADEQRYARQIAQLLNVPLHVVDLGFDTAEFSFALPTHAHTPRIGTLQHAIDQIMQALAHQQGTKSFFTGGGGDAVFSYLKTAAPAADAFRECGLRAGLATIRNLSDLHRCTLWTAGQLTLAKLQRSRNFVAPERSFLAADVGQAPVETHPWLDAPAKALPGDTERIFALTAAQMFRDSAPRGAVRRLRMPLLSQPVVEACLRAPSWMWIAGGQNRTVARTAFADLLPSEILSRRSKGTFMSYVGGLYSRSRTRMRDYLLDGQLNARGLLDPAALHHYMTDDAPMRDRSFIRIFDLCMIENWVRHHS